MWKLKLMGLLQGTIIYRWIKRYIIWKWKKSGQPLPPPYTVKRSEIKKISHEFGCKTFVETGTFLGATTSDLVDSFSELYTIELSTKLYDRAKKKFAKQNKVNVLQGDSGKVLFDVVPKLNSTTMFWLDGHYSGGVTAKGETDCPIFNELDAIFQLKRIDFVIMIDDARCFSDPLEHDYPPIEVLENYINENSPIKMSLSVDLDIITFKPEKI